MATPGPHRNVAPPRNAGFRPAPRSSPAAPRADTLDVVTVVGVIPPPELPRSELRPHPQPAAVRIGVITIRASPERHRRSHCEVSLPESSPPPSVDGLGGSVGSNRWIIATHRGTTSQVRHGVHQEQHRDPRTPRRPARMYPPATAAPLPPGTVRPTPTVAPRTRPAPNLTQQRRQHLAFHRSTHTTSEQSGDNPGQSRGQQHPIGGASLDVPGFRPHPAE